MQIVMCESSLFFFQTADNYNLCQRKLILRYRTPTLQKHGSVWVYRFSEQQHVTALLDERCLDISYCSIRQK